MRRLAFLLLLILLPASSEAQSTDIIRGRVVGEEGAGIAGALVEAWSLESGIRRTASTDEEGRYTIAFPDGGGRYRLRISAIDRATYEGTIERLGDQEVLYRDVRLGTRPLDVGALSAQAQRSRTPSRGDVGGSQRSMSGDALSRLPLDATDPASIAALTPGVVATPGADSVGGAGGFSVAGQRASQNNVTLDGATFASMLSGSSFGGSSLGLPQEGLRSTSVITNTYDVARGQFSGGQVAMSTRAGTNNLSGSLTAGVRDDALQGGAGRTAWSDGFTQGRLSGGIGGPIIRDRLLYNVSLSTQLRDEDQFSLLPRSAAGYEQVNAHPDSVARFLDILNRVYGIPADEQVGAYARGSDALTGLARVDWNATQAHALSLRWARSRFSLDNMFVRPLDLIENGGSLDNSGDAWVGTLTSRFGTSWVNELRASVSSQEQTIASALNAPEARARVGTGDGAHRGGVSFLAFGGDVLPPRATSERTLEVANELSLLVGSHRLKLGGLYNTTDFEQQTAFARNGVFSFNSLADLEAGRATSFTRSLLDRPTEGSGWNGAAYLGDTWRPIDALQLVFGVRAEASGFGAAPPRDAAIEHAFGLRTDNVPEEFHVSPRLGFSWRLSGEDQPLRQVRGGVGEFRGRAPYSLYAGVLDGPAGGESLLFCVGDAQVPAPDLRRYREDPSSVPTACADDSQGTRAGAKPNVSAFDDSFGAPRSWRASLGYQMSLRPGMTLSVDAMYARGVDQYGVRDANLDTSGGFALASEGGRRIFAEPTAIDARTGTVPLAATRRDPAYAHVYDIHSDLEMEARSVTFALNGMVLPRGLTLQAGYTLAKAEDQSSFTFGSAAGGFAGNPTGGNPNEPAWGAADQDRRHSMQLMLGKQFGQSLELALVGRANSGAPFTPRVAGDLNGDGAGNDVAFIHDPAGTSDAALAAGMSALLESAPGRVRECLRDQMGQLAERNSCRNGWDYGVDLRASFQPELGRLGRRVSFNVDVMNLAAGADLLLHGSDELQGWGTGGFYSDPVLLYPRGFDANAGAFRYEVNPNFGRPMNHVMGHRSPFGIQLSARVGIGRQPPRIGGIAGLGGGQVFMMTATSGGPMPAHGGGGVTRVEGGEGGRQPGAIVERMFAAPFDSMLARREELALAPEQVARLEALRDSLAAKNAPLRADVERTVARVGMPEAIQAVAPKVQEAQRNTTAAVERAREVLTPEQWEKVPADVREPRGLQMRTEMRSGRMDPAVLIERMLPAPVDSIATMGEALGLTSEQASKIEAIRVSLAEKNVPVRAEISAILSGRVATNTENPGALFERIGPKLNEARVNTQAALDQVRAVLTPEQWEKVPQRIRDALRVGNFQIRGN